MATAVAAPDTSTSSESVSCDVAVIGGGFTGLNAALELAHQGLDVVVIEAGGLGFGASGRSGGQVNLGLNHGPDALLKKFGKPQGERLIDLIINTPETVFRRIKQFGLDCDPVQNGWVQGAVSRQYLLQQISTADEYSRHGCHLELLDAQHLAKRTGAQNYIGGLFCESAGSLHPLSYTRELARTAMQKGARIFTHSRVTGIDNPGGNQWVLATEQGQVTSKQVLLCTNGYTDNLVKGMQRKVVPVRSLLVATEPLDEQRQNEVLPNQVTFVDKRRLILYFRYDRDGRLCVGDHGPMRDQFCIDDFNAVKQRAIDVFPQLSSVQWDYHWGGRVAMTKSSLPFMYEIAPGLTAGMGYNGRGVGMGTMMGISLAESVINNGNCAIPKTSPASFLMHKFHSAGVSMTIKWMALRDHLDTLT
jgi:glycine/D-amino acid oxidase-like deaminating enzyme